MTQADLRMQEVHNAIQADRIVEAYSLAVSYCAENDDDAEMWALLACVAGRLERYQETVAAATRALEINPSLAEVWQYRGRAELLMHGFEAARHSLQSALELNPNNLQTRMLLIQALMNSHDPGGAIDVCEDVLRHDPVNVDALGYMAELCELTHEYDRAREYASRTLSFHPRHPIANIVMAKLERREGDFKAARQRLGHVLEQTLDARHTALVNGELAKVLDRLGNYDEAFAACKVAQTAADGIFFAQFSGQVSFNRIAKSRAAITPQTVAAWTPYVPGDNWKPPLFLVAFPRSGTTLTEQILGAHAELVTSDELPLLDDTIKAIPDLSRAGSDYPDNLGSLEAEDITNLRKYYRESMVRSLGHDITEKRLIDKLPLNIMNIAFIHRVFPDAPVLFVKRDPRDVCLSAFMQMFMANNAMQNFTDIETTARFYAAVMDLWQQQRDLLGLNLIEVRYEDIVEDIEREARRLLKFMGLPWEEAVLDFCQ